MMARLTILAFALTSILLAGADLAPSAAELRPAGVFSDGMVVQRGVPVPVWGWAAANARVTASLGGQTRTATADATGAWRVAFPAMKAGGPHELTVATIDARVVIHDVLVGDVWVASGQSRCSLSLLSR